MGENSKVMLFLKYIYFQAGKSGIKSMTISRKIIDQNEVVDLWRLESNDFDEWEVGSIPIPSIKDSFEVRNF